MGTYLSCGIATKITISKRYSEDNDKIIERISKKIDLNLYDRNDYEDGIELILKKELIEKHAVDFAIEQVEKLSERDKKEAKESIEKLRGLNFEKMIEKAKEEPVYEFQLYEGNRVCNDISYLDPDHNCQIYCDIISIICEGKVFFECYWRMFEYLRNCIIESSKNPIRTATFVTIIG